jgi:hypothetical protein
MSKTNPNGANQYSLDPRQQLCWDYYIDPNSETFSNALQSALRAGYEPDTAKNIMLSEWFKEKRGRLELLNKAEEKLRESLEYDPRTKEGIDSSLLRIQTDVSKFLAGTLGKDKGYTTRQEFTGKDGEKLEAIQVSVVNSKDENKS